jgi:hypothetical protein
MIGQQYHGFGKYHERVHECCHNASGEDLAKDISDVKGLADCCGRTPPYYMQMLDF